MAKPGELTPKQAAFVREYLVDRNGTQAAIRAGYSPKTAGQIAEQNLKKLEISSRVQAATQVSAAKTETDSEWVRRRLKEEAEDFSEFASHSARIRALELVAKLNGDFEIDNTQQNKQPLAIMVTFDRPTNATRKD